MTVLQVLDFSQNAFHVPAAFPAAGIGDNTIVAEIVAPPGNRDITRDSVSSYTAWNNIAVGLCQGQFHVDGLAAGFSLSHQLGQAEIAVRAGNDIHITLLDQFFLGAFSHASQNTDKKFPALTPTGIEGFKTMQDFLFGIVTDRAGVQENGIGFLFRPADVVIGHLHDGSYCFAVSHIHLTSVGFYIEFFHCLP